MSVAPVMPARMPPPEIYTAIKAAAIKWDVPWTFLAATAYIESNYNPEANGEVTKDGWRARGLFQLSPATIERYKVANPFNPEQASNAAAEFVSHLAKGTGFDWYKVAASYVWGPANMVQAVNDGKPFPEEVRVYVRRVIGAQTWIQNQSKPIGGRMWEQINAAILGLAKANPKTQAAQDLLKRWNTDYVETLRKLNTDAGPIDTAALISVPAFREALDGYAAVYHRAANTDGSTPPPWLLSPKLWDELIRHKYQPPPELNTFDYDPPAGGGNAMGMLLVLGALILFSSGGRSRRW